MAFVVLTVCVGNVCRSPMAERMLALHLTSAAGDFEVHSAGTRALQGTGMHPQSRADLEAAGGTGDGFVARQLNDPMIRDADLVLTATTDVRARVLEDVPGALRRTFTILDFAALVDSAPRLLPASDLVRDASDRRSTLRDVEHDVPDPINQGPEIFAMVSDQLLRATRTIAAGLTASR
ncbi:protein-tyrosine-phosphatase [Marmoricola endophyticus]|uniref:Protein-tyrosine-phosphatase n=1 Tax=Marmoricola endophyticus TaxID=2040280 RepID=A0A917BHZ0_9ACTN|nr:protein-tyrosine-phosphatase [Marmoricola endophyticus]GGF43792.1 protein-tyrosine-phosphatase [Marmoricola endophyticus]